MIASSKRILTPIGPPKKYGHPLRNIASTAAMPLPLRNGVSGNAGRTECIMFGKRTESLYAIVMNSGVPSEPKEPSKEAGSPRSEPEIIPPKRDSEPSGGTARFSMRSERVYIWRPGLFTGIVAILLIASALAVALAIIIGLAAISLPVVAAVVIALIVGRLLRNRYL